MPVDAEDLLNYVGVALALAIVFSVVVIALAASSAPARDRAAPETEWEITQVNDSTVRITHAGGDPLPAENVVVTADTVRRNTPWEGLVAEGDTAVIEAGPGELVRIYWDDNRGERDLMASKRVE